ncbi:SRPBCC family protein [Sphingosinithalassobacter sp. CS137]|uniref:SRPBCC family protein n=1 Tax=Sphingosinithalassobacter sp. CS137 TaxID=2762748 RepID=UPI00165D8D25|nr:SRPBCC family protein [Sphingosinithalassobacter sp. CS137]
MSETTRKATVQRVAAGLGVLGVAGVALLATRSSGPRSGEDDAPGYSGRHRTGGAPAIVGKTVAIAKPSRRELYTFWRDFTNLPSFMENIDAVEKLDGNRWRWTIKAPAGRTVTVVSEIAQEIEGELIAWRSTEDSEIETNGRISFRDASGNRGTYVTAEIEYRPPFGNAGRSLAKLFQREPAIQARRDLRRFKMLMETGEIATPANRLEEAA